MKSTDYEYRYEAAKSYYALGQYSRAASILTDLINIMKGTSVAEECMHMLGMSYYHDKDYEMASMTFQQYINFYPRGTYAELARFYSGKALYLDSPEPRLDQSKTVSAISAFQEYLDLFPDATMKHAAQQHLFELQDKLVEKELYSAQLYYDLGPYFGNCNFGGNNYEACIITSQNALKDYPYSKLRENFAILLMKSKYNLAMQSVDEKKYERFQDAEDECYGFINEYPDSKERATAEKYIEVCKEYISKHTEGGFKGFN